MSEKTIKLLILLVKSKINQGYVLIHDCTDNNEIVALVNSEIQELSIVLTELQSLQKTFKENPL